jgi:hypothetical protein
LAKNQVKKKWLFCQLIIRSKNAIFQKNAKNLNSLQIEVKKKIVKISMGKSVDLFLVGGFWPKFYTLILIEKKPFPLYRKSATFFREKTQKKFFFSAFLCLQFPKISMHNWLMFF